MTPPQDNSEHKYYDKSPFSGGVTENVTHEDEDKDPIWEEDEPSEEDE